MRRRNFFKRALAIILTASTILTQLSFTDFGTSAVRAAEADGDGEWTATSYIVNGDFESGGTDGWTITNSVGSGPTVNTGSSGNNLTKYYNVWLSDSAAGTFSMSQVMTLPAGEYYFTLRLGGDGTSSKRGSITAAIANASTSEVISSKTATSGSTWGTFTTHTGDKFTLSQETSVKFEISSSLAKAQYFAIDDIILYQYVIPNNIVLDDLTDLLDCVPEDYSNMGFTADSVKALKEALEKAALCKEDSDAATIEDAYNALTAALDGLVFDANIFVTKVSNYAEDSIRGVDISSYLTLMDSFDALNSNITDPAKKLGFRDWDGKLLSKQGFFDLLADSGVNYVRLRVWNDPYNSTTRIGYGGGNNDLDKAIEMGKYATEAGMKVLIDFHFSDFWADPGKQEVPKAWDGKTVAQKATLISSMVTNALTKLVTDNGVDVGMVQIGNETTASFCGESNTTNMSTLFDAGCDAIHTFNDNNGTDILAALHFTNPETSGKYTTIAAWLNTNNVSYDVFASSYYPFWHGTLANLTSVLNTIASTYGKYVMVAETSWVYTNEDGDGHENTMNEAKGLGTNAYGVSAQDQANEVRDVINAVNNVTATVGGKKAGLGVFYWEPAWIPVQYAYDDNGKLDNTILNSNKALWETYGSGWASSAASEYDAEDAGKWYGGSSWDNQAMFDFWGNPLDSLSVYNYNYLSYGSVTELAISSITCDSVTIETGTTLTAANLSANATVKYNDTSTSTHAVVWDDDDIAAVTTAAAKATGIGTYTVTGLVEIDGVHYTAACTVNVIPKNLLTNGSFESTSAWTNSGTGWSTLDTETPKTGTYALKFYRSAAMTLTTSQTITTTASGYYAASIYLQGLSGTGSNSGEQIYLSVKNNRSGVTYSSSNVTLAGWKEWVQATVSNILVTKGDTLTFTLNLKANSEAWGTVDDAYLYVTQAIAEALSITESSYDLTYGDTQQIAYTITQDAASPEWSSNNENAVTVDEDGVVTAVGVGNATITATTIDGSNLTATCTVNVSAKDLTDAVITLASNSYIYTGSDIEPAITSVVLDGETLTTDDYTVGYSDNTNIGTATVTITGKGNYTGTADTAFTIGSDIADAVITLEPNNYTYDGTAKEPAVTSVVLNDTPLTVDVDYTVGYSNNTNAGTTATVTITGKGLYVGTATKTFKINGISISDAVITLDISSYTYDGTAKTPTVTSVVLNDTPLTVTNDYTVGYSENTNAGEAATVTITGAGNYTGIAAKTFAINEASISDAVITLGTNSYIYDGTAREPAITSVVLDGETLTTDDYTVGYSENTNVGTATVTITGTGNYTGTAPKTFTIDEASISDAVITLDTASYTYDGTAKEPTIASVKLGDKDLTPDDYDVNYSKNTDAGTAATVTITGKGNYKDDAFTYFTINKASVSGAGIRLGASSYTFDNTDKRPTVASVTLGGKALTANDYTVGYNKNRNAGIATVTISGKGNYTGTATANFTITKASKRITVSRTTQNKVYGDKAFTLGAAATSGERPTYSLSNTKVATVDTAGKVTIIGCGTVVITIKSAASANYNAATDARVTLTVTPKKASISSASSRRAGRLTASWKRDKTVTGYEVYYSTNKNFKKAQKVTAKNNRTTSTTITKRLTRGKKYYVRVRSYTTVGGKTVYGAYSTARTVTIKR